MKLSQSTYDLLNTFASINPSLIIRPGKTIRTMDPSESMVVRADFENEFPQTLAIYDLPGFLSVIKMFNDPELEFKDTHVVIKETKNPDSKVRYYFSHEDTVTEPAGDIVLPGVQVEFTLTPEMISSICRSATTMGLLHVVVTRNSDTSVLITTTSHNIPTSHKHECIADAIISPSVGEFVIIFHFERFSKIGNRKYRVRVSDKFISEFKSIDEGENSIIFWPALANKSVIPSI